MRGVIRSSALQVFLKQRQVEKISLVTVLPTHNRAHTQFDTSEQNFTPSEARFVVEQECEDINIVGI